MPAAEYDIKIEQGALFEMIVTIKDSQPTPVPVNLTGYLFEGQIRQSNDATEIVAEFDYDILDQTTDTGKVRFYIPSDETAVIPVHGKSPIRGKAVFLYDISYDVPAGEKFRLLQGKATVSGEVTK